MHGQTNKRFMFRMIRIFSTKIFDFTIKGVRFYYYGTILYYCEISVWPTLGFTVTASDIYGCQSDFEQAENLRFTIIMNDIYGCGSPN